VVTDRGNTLTHGKASTDKMDLPPEGRAALDKRNAIQQVMKDASLSGAERSKKIQAIMKGNFPNVESADDQEYDSSADGNVSRNYQNSTSVLPSHMLATARSNQNKESSRTAMTLFHSMYGNSTPSIYDEQDNESASTDTPTPGVGFGSLPHPEELITNEVVDPNSGLAVATAVDLDEDDPDYLYEAIEYDPNSKPPLHKNRRFRTYTCFAFIIILIVISCLVVYIVSETRTTKIITVDVDYQAQPTVSPSASPITDRERSGIILQLQTGVLLRNETFEEMDEFDPRRRALDWILNIDVQQFESDDARLYQRFALAILAFAFDSKAWYYCPSSMHHSFLSQCVVTDSNNSTETSARWLSRFSECEWYGVTCSADEIVRGVDLIQNELIGTIPHEIAALSFLQFFALPYNCIFGTIPPEISSLRHLLSLELQENALSGVIPASLYDLTKLQQLNLANQYGQTRTCTTSRGQEIDMKYRMGGLGGPFDAFGLEGNPSSNVGVFRSLKGLYLQNNAFTGEISDEIGNLKYLRFLDLTDNFIEGPIPEDLMKVRKLRILLLSENFLHSSLPSDIGQLSDLQSLTVNGNSMHGDIPPGLYNLTKLENLRLDETLMANSPWLVDPDEGFTGTLSERIGELKKLRLLLLSNNPISGTIPNELGNCTQLTNVRLHRTNLTGTMPMSVCLLRDKFLNNKANTGVLYADCRPYNRTGVPWLKCGCCTDCCDHTTGVCIADD